MNLSPVFKQRFFDSNGAPLAGGLLYSYAAGTTTPQATYSNATGTANANPVVLDSQGYADVWLDPTLAYKLVLKDSGGAQQWSEDNVTVTTSGLGTWNTSQTYAQGDIVKDSSGFGLFYVSLINNNTGNALTNVSAWRVFAGNVRSVSTSVTLLVTDDLVRSNSTAGNLTLTLPACATTPIGKKITVKDVGTGGNTTTVKGSGADLVDGNNTYAFALNQNLSAVFMNNGSSWDSVVHSPKVPAVQTYSSGSGTYTPPAGALYLRIRMVGGGGGGGGGGSFGDSSGGNNGSAGSNGAATTFGTTFLSAGGGSGGTGGTKDYAGYTAGGNGGAVSTAAGFSGFSANGSAGAPSGVGTGGSTPLAQGGYGALGAISNGIGPTAGAYGSGGGGGQSQGGGGGAGAYIEGIVAAPLVASYSYAVGALGAGGAGGANGSGGTTGQTGGNGGTGYIWIEACYE